MRIRFIKLFEGLESNPFIQPHLLQLDKPEILSKIYKRYLYYIHPNKEIYSSRETAKKVYDLFQNPDLIQQFKQIVINDIMNVVAPFSERKAAWFVKKLIEYMSQISYSIVKNPNVETILMNKR